MTSKYDALQIIVRDLAGAGYTEPESLVELQADAARAIALPDDPKGWANRNFMSRPLALVVVRGGLAHDALTVTGYGKPEVHILDFDRDDEDHDERAEWVTVARETLAIFRAHGAKTGNLDREVDHLAEETDDAD
jgi:hypothetical protein